jgi:hypothetical protein
MKRSSSLTARYVDEVLDVSGVKARGFNRIKEISHLAPEEGTKLVADVAQRVKRHYDRNLKPLVRDLRDTSRQHKAYYFGSPWPLPSATGKPDWFLRKSALYYNKVVIEDPLEECIYPQAWKVAPAAFTAHFIEGLAELHSHWPWIAEGIMELIPAPERLGFGANIHEYIAQDSKDTQGWGKQALWDEDLGLRGEAYLKLRGKLTGKSYSPEFLATHGGLRKQVLESALGGASSILGDCFFGSFLTRSSPTTEFSRYWRLFAYWASLRAGKGIAHGLSREKWEDLVRETKKGRAWLALDARELTVLSELSPQKIIEIRNSTDYSFEHFREDLGNAVDEIEGLKLEDENTYKQVARQVWEKVRESAKDIKKDSNRIKKSIGVSAGVLGLSLTLGVLPFDIAKLASALIGMPTVLDIAKEYLELREMRDSTGYFLVKLQQSGKL